MSGTINITRTKSMHPSSLLKLICAVVAVSFAFTARAAEPSVKPIRALYIAGGCCHDYSHQKDIIKAGLEARANISVDVIYSDDTSTHPPLPIYSNPDYAKGYDIVIHHECSADISAQAVVEGVLAPHRNGIPGVNLHCAVHSYRIGNPGQPAEPGTAHALWFEYLGLQSSGHGPQEPIEVTYTDKDHPITKTLSDWTTGKEEHYNNVKLFGKAHPLAHGKQTIKNRDGSEKTNDFVDVWTNEYHGVRVFNTTLIHNSVGVADERYLDLVTRGVLWACDKLNDRYLKPYQSGKTAPN